MTNKKKRNYSLDFNVPSNAQSNLMAAENLVTKTVSNLVFYAQFTSTFI